MNQINDALNFYDQALKKSLKELGEKHVSTAKLYHSLGILYASQEDKEKSLFYHQKALILFEEMYGPHSSLVIATLYFMSECYRLTNDSYSALKYAKKALCRVLKTDKSSVREVLFKTIPIENNATEFKFSLNAVIVNSYFLYTKTGEIDYLLEAFDYQKYAIRLHQKILHYQMSQASNLQMAKQAQALYRIYLKIAFEMQTTFKQKNTKPSKKQTIKQLRERNHAKETFLIFEINNSLLLFSDVKNQNAKIKAQIPTALLQKEKQLQKQLATLEQKILQMQAKNKVKTISNELLQTKSQFANLKLQYTELIQKFETDYPQYHQLKRQVEIVPLENLQQKLPSDTALIEYFIGEKYLYTFVITCNDTQFLQSAKPDDFEELIEAFKASIDEIDKSEYLELAFELHELLIAPITNNNSPITSSQSPVTNLKIIPSGILSTIPFEALLTEEIQGNTKYADLPYLLLQYDISYHYSATLWSQSMDAERVETRPTFVGFAPVYKSEQEQTLEETTIRGIYNNETTRSVRIGEETYSELIHSEEEVNSIQSYFNAKNIPTQTFLHAQANSNNFLQNVGKHKYVLISAHGFYNEKQPDLTGIILSPSVNQTSANPSDVAKSLTAEKKASIRAKNSPSSELPLWRGQGEVNGDVWSENIFYLSDAYNLELNADLVVLSCCETGVGKLAKGEGVMALNRGFFYAGAKNVIYTLFKVYDQASCQLTKHLFQQILKSKPYALALKEAKRQLILQGKAPIHWAGYLLIGE